MYFLLSQASAIRLPADCSPIAHRSPRPRVETSPVWPAPQPQTTAERLAELQRVAEGEKLWRLLQEAAGGTTVPVEVVEEPKPVEVVYPPYDYVCYSQAPRAEHFSWPAQRPAEPAQRVYASPPDYTAQFQNAYQRAALGLGGTG